MGFLDDEVDKANGTPLKGNGGLLHHLLGLSDRHHQGLLSALAGRKEDGQKAVELKSQADYQRAFLPSTYGQYGGISTPTPQELSGSLY